MPLIAASRLSHVRRPPTLSRFCVPRTGLTIAMAYRGLKLPLRQRRREFLGSRRVPLAQQAAHHRIPASYSGGEYAEGGGLMTYGSDVMDAFRQAGNYVGPRSSNEGHHCMALLGRPRHGPGRLTYKGSCVLRLLTWLCGVLSLKLLRS